MFKAAVTSPRLPGLEQEVPSWRTRCSVLHTGAFWEEGQGMFVQKSKRRFCFMAGIFFLRDLQLVPGQDVLHRE